MHRERENRIDRTNPTDQIVVNWVGFLCFILIFGRQIPSKKVLSKNREENIKRVPITLDRNFKIKNKIIHGFPIPTRAYKETCSIANLPPTPRFVLFLPTIYNSCNANDTAPSFAKDIIDCINTQDKRLNNISIFRQIVGSNL